MLIFYKFDRIRCSKKRSSKKDMHQVKPYLASQLKVDKNQLQSSQNPYYKDLLLYKTLRISPAQTFRRTGHQSYTYSSKSLELQGAKKSEI
jgi:hypothetical protein